MISQNHNLVMLGRRVLNKQCNCHAKHEKLRRTPWEPFFGRGLDVDGYYRVYSTHFGGPSLCIIQRMGNHYSVGAMTSSMGKTADMEWGYETEKRGTLVQCRSQKFQKTVRYF